MKVIVNKTCATVSGAEMLTSGMVGKTIDVEFSADWLGLIKIAVFTNGAVTRDVLDPNGAVIIPWEVLVKSNKRVSVGFYGYRIENGEKVLAIPTIWAELGAIRAGADPSGDPSAELSPTVAEQLQSDVNDLDERVTEIEEHGGGGGTTDHTQLTNRDASNQHPMTAITGLEDALASKQPSGDYATTQELDELANIVDGKGTYSKPSGGIPKTDLASAVQASLGRADSALQTAPVSSVNGKTGAVNLVPADLGIGSVFQLKGSKPTFADLPSSGNAIGDVWYVIADSVGYIWLNDGTVDRWEQLGMEIDLSAYRTAAAQDVIDNGKVDKVTGKGLSTNDYTDADKAKVASAVQPSDLNDYIPKVLGELDGGHTIADNNYIPMAEAPDGDAKKVNVEAFKMYINNGMASQSDLDDYALKTDLDDYVAIEQGVAHAGEFLVVGEDGNVTTRTLSEWQGGSY